MEASQPESKIPGPGGAKDKRRSFLPAPKRAPASTSSSAITSTSSSSLPAPLGGDTSPPSSSSSTISQNASPGERETPQETIPGAEKLIVGRRILISGVKPGILRFVGRTGLAPGFWCGIELFDASGLNDGEVEGRRYFTCKPFRGIFAPLDKVVLDEAYPDPVEEDLPASRSVSVSESEDLHDKKSKEKPLPVSPEHSSDKSKQDDSDEVETLAQLSNPDPDREGARELSGYKSDTVLLLPGLSVTVVNHPGGRSVDRDVSKIPSPKPQTGRVSESVRRAVSATDTGEVGDNITAPTSSQTSHVIEYVDKLSKGNSRDVCRIPTSKSQIARLSAIPKFGQGSGEKGLAKSKSADGIKETNSRIAVPCKRSVSGHDASRVDLDSTKHRRPSDNTDEEEFSLNRTFSKDLEQRLKSDSRQYLNITFNKETPSQPLPTSNNNLPDVVSSASPSPPRETPPAAPIVPGTLNQTYSAHDSASLASDMSLGLLDPDILKDETNLLEGIVSQDRIAPATSESDVSLSGNSSSTTLEETSIGGAGGTEAFAPPPPDNSTPLRGVVDFKKFLTDNGDDMSDALLDVDGAELASTTTTTSTSVQQA